MSTATLSHTLSSEEANKSQQLLATALDEAHQAQRWAEQQNVMHTQKVVAAVELVSAVKQESRTFKLAVSTDLRKLANIFGPLRDAFALLKTEMRVRKVCL